MENKIINCNEYDGDIIITVTGTNEFHNNLEDLFTELGFCEIYCDNVDDNDDYTIKYYFEDRCNTILNDVMDAAEEIFGE